MTNIRNNVKAYLIAGVILALSTNYAMAVTIDCDNGGSIQQQLNNGEFFIEFSGTCNENVFIAQDGVTIRSLFGNPSQAIISGGLGISGATRVRIENITITGQSVFIVDGATARIQNSVIENTQNGVAIVRNSHARLENNIIGPALVDDGNVSCTPLCVFDDASVSMIGNTVTGATNDPLAGSVLGIGRNSSVLMRGGNHISNNGTQPAVLVFEDASLRIDNPFGLARDRITGDMDAATMVLVSVREMLLTGNLSVSAHSMIRLGSTVGFGGDPSNIEVNGDITLSRDSALVVENPEVVLNGTITCLDNESSLNTNDFAGDHTIDCTDFNGMSLSTPGAPGTPGPFPFPFPSPPPSPSPTPSPPPFPFPFP